MASHRFGNLSELVWVTFFGTDMAEGVALCLKGTSNTSAPGPDHLGWDSLKRLCRNDQLSTFFLRLFNQGTTLHTWPKELKASDTCVTPKHNKTDHSVLKAYRPICLLRTIGKLWEKLIANRLQHDCAVHGLLHPSQCGGVRSHSTEDAGLILIHHLRQARSNGLCSSSLAIDIEQFFPSVNHSILLLTMSRLGFPDDIVELMRHYLLDRQTRFKWSDRLSDFVDCTVGVGQGSCLSPILSALVLVSALYAIGRKLPANTDDSRSSEIVFVDDMALTVSTASFGANNLLLRFLLPIVVVEFARVGVTIGLDKLELAQFPSKSYSGTSPPPPQCILGR